MSIGGCGQRQQQPAPQQQSAQMEQQADKAPDQLKALESNIEKIIKQLGGPAIGVEEDKSGEKSGQQGQGANNQAAQGGQGEGGGQQNQAPQPPQQPEPWEKEVTSIINTMHYQWNDYMPSAVKKGASKTLVDNFSNALNDLTDIVIAKNKTNALLAANYLYAYIPDLYSLYKSSESPEIKRIRYFTRNAMLNSITANWAQVDKDMNSLKPSWGLYKNVLGKDQQESAGKLDLSISELDKVVQEKNQPLIDIKGRIVMSNIESIEKAMEKK